ncbi:MAG: hypothetical protein LWX56_04740 [Ignavibacteria bacterium]|nr:hypothetical protein [Ignavibacteria bacterium]
MSGKTILSILFAIIGIFIGRYVVTALLKQPDKVQFESYDWTQKEYLGVKMEIPFELKPQQIDIPAEAKAFIVKMENYSYDSKPLTFLISKTEYDNSVDADIDMAVEGAMRSMRGRDNVSDFTYQSKPTQKYYLSGREVSGSMKIEGKPVEFQSEFYVNGAKLLQIVCITTGGQENREASERIMKNMKVTL